MDHPYAFSAWRLFDSESVFLPPARRRVRVVCLYDDSDMAEELGSLTGGVCVGFGRSFASVGTTYCLLVNGAVVGTVEGR
ncbi:hypothetical protein TcWFU_010344 [Taenia crassiceps]|uniref:Uncharacterized protein n=1 Tax=Taenia crassiceps TaxID=6207 RepID=A0ABR4QA38_9CEST